MHQSCLHDFQEKSLCSAMGSIHVGTQPHHGTAGGAAPAHHGDDAGTANAIVDFVHTANL